MSKKPQKRLVSKREYIGRLAEAANQTLIGFACLGGGAYFLWLFLMLVADMYREQAPWTVYTLALPFVGISAFFLWISKNIWTMASEIKHVTPITHKNNHFLPAKETLVRASNVPPAQQQAELLRATQVGTEIPPEQLLRALQGSGQDI
ncbi:MAG: hypothetical protein JWN14_2595 [Chthonomonadales bacterium]|nr:hypothetical protein [Chthonomonadales bacterium]